MKFIIVTLLLLGNLHSTAQFKINNFEDAQIYFQGLFNSAYEKQYIDEYGNIGIDMGAPQAVAFI